MASWKKTISSPFKKLFNQQQQQQQQQQQPRDKQSMQQGSEINRVMDLQGEVMACGYQDVQVMWSILDKSKSSSCNMSS